MSIYRFSTDDLATISYAYYREYVYLADGSTEIRFGTVRYNADGSFTLISDAGRGMCRPGPGQARFLHGRR